MKYLFLIIFIVLALKTTIRRYNEKVTDEDNLLMTKYLQHNNF